MLPNHRTRLAYLVSRYPAISHTFILREVVQLQAQGFEIEVASINRPDQEQTAMSEQEQQAMHNTYYVKQHGWFGALIAHLWGLQHPMAYLSALFHAIRLGGANLAQVIYNLFYFTEALMLGRWMKTRELQHLHVHFASAAANVALILKQYQHISLSMTVHGPDEFYDVRGQWLPQKIDAADFVVCIGAFARSQLMHISPPKNWHKLEICPLGVDTQHYRPLPHASADTPFTVLCVGRLASAKGQMVLINACHALLTAGRDIRLVLVGTGPEEKQLKQYVSTLGLQKNILFTGALNQNQVHACYSCADVFALASFAEGIPVVLMEAMACGVPCISTRITGIPELIRDGEDGLLVNPSDSDELASALLRLMDNTTLRQQLAHNGRARVQQKYNLNRNIERLGRIFEKRLTYAHG